MPNAVLVSLFLLAGALAERKKVATSIYRCNDGKTIPSDWVNDDFCDCDDGSDETATSACGKGKFTCVNEGFEARIVPSSRVNDGVCDCCDGSDERKQGNNEIQIKCPNVCLEMAVAAREEAAIQASFHAQGYAVKQQWMASFAEKKAKWEEVSKEVGEELEEITAQIPSAEEEQKAATEVATAARKDFDANWEKEMEEAGAERAFNLLDNDHNGVLTPSDIEARSEFDRDGDGVVDPREVLHVLDLDDDFLLSEEEQNCDLDTFTEYIWPLIEAQLTAPRPAYPTDIQLVVDTADAKSEVLEKLRARKRDLEQRLHDATPTHGVELGPNGEFSGLDGVCLPFTAGSYNYNVCVFGRVTQKDQHGNDVDLGSFTKWGGPLSLEYDQGAHCYAGPVRSSKASLVCRANNTVLSIEEPSRCTYQIIIGTPGACLPPSSPSSSQSSSQAGEPESKHVYGDPMHYMRSEL